MIGPNYFQDPKGNRLNIKFEDSLLYDIKFRTCDEIFNFYDLDYVYYVTTLFFRDLYFEMRLFHVDWVEHIFCSRFFSSFTVYFSPS